MRHLGLGSSGDGKYSERELVHARVIRRMTVVSAILALTLVGVASPSAAAGGPGGSSGCIDSDQALVTTNVTSDTAVTACPGFTPDFTTNSWNTGFTNLYTNTEPCYGKTNIYSYTYDTSNGGLYGYASTYANSEEGCSANAAEVSLNVGLHGASFSAWKSGSAYYTVQANYTFWNYLPVATYCQDGGLPTAQDNESTLVAMYDDNLGTGVGASTNGFYDFVGIWETCNNAESGQNNGIQVSASFRTSTAIANGDTLVPRASVVATVVVNNPSTWPYASHSNATLDFNNDGYGYITLNSIWVY